MNPQNRERSFNGACWHYVSNQNRIQALVSTNHVSEFLASCLAVLDIDPGAPVDTFLHPSISHLLDPWLMKDMDRAVSRFNDAISNRESIRIVTDYDADGTMSSLILQSVLAICGHSRVSYHIPDRKVEGYGFTCLAAQKAIEDGVSLIVTADIGVRDEPAISMAKKAGIDVIVLDHHLPEGVGVPPSAYAVICPPQPGCNYPNKALAACGISLKFAQALLAEHPRRDQIIRSLLKLAALGTVADVVSLRTTENRAIVSIGLDSLNRDPHKPGLDALLSVSQALPGNIDASTISFFIAPRINAAGRMATATLIIELLHARNRVEAQGLASKLDAMNVDRKYIQEQMVERAIECIGDSDAPFLLVALPESAEWHAGVAGIVAGRLKEKYNRPVAVGTITGEDVTFSLRSTPGVHAVTALTAVSKMLTKFGGHAAAAGFSCNRKNLDAVREGLCENTSLQLGGTTELAVVELSVKLSPNDLKKEDFEDIKLLEPCGACLHRPLICLENVHLCDIRWMKEVHLSATILTPQMSIRVVWFNTPERIRETLNSPLDIVGELQQNKWNGETRNQFLIRDACLSGQNVYI